MPKMKTNRGAVKRFKLTGKSNRIKRRRANRNHILTKKATKRKRQLRAMPSVGAHNLKAVQKMLRKR